MRIMVDRYRPTGGKGKTPYDVVEGGQVIVFPNGRKSPFAKGHKKYGGRQKGAKNKVPTLIKAATMLALENVGHPVFVYKDLGNGKKGKLERIDNGPGGLVGFLEYAAKNHTPAMMGLLGKILPLQLTGEGGGPIKTLNASMTLQEMSDIYKESLKEG